MNASTTQQILSKIEVLQSVQKACAPTTREWINASAQLRPLFVEMARRQNGVR